MIDNNKIIRAKNSNKYRDKLIDEYSGYILKCASKAAGRYVDKSDDIYSEAMIAFNNSITNYSSDKGDFYAFAAISIRNRIIDYLRSENRHINVVPMSTLSTKNEHGDIVEYEIEDKNSGISETAIEIESLKNDLSQFGISFFDIAASSPKTNKTISACINSAEYIVKNKELLKGLYEKKTLPSKQLTDVLKIGKKITERYRKYIIMAVLIMDGDYEILADYLKNGKKVCG